MRTSVRTAMPLIGVFLAAVCLSGCTGADPESADVLDPASSSWEDIEDAAIDEGELTVYLASQEGLNQALVEAFEAAYPQISVNQVRLESGASTARVSAEIESGAPTADVVQLADNVILDEHADWFRPLEGIPNLENYPAERVEEHYVFHQAAPFVITYNTELIDSPPTTWADLAASDDLSQGLMIDPRAANSFMAMAAFVREQEGDDVLRALGEGVGGITDNSATAAQQVAAGEIAFAFPNVREHTTVARSQGAPVDTIVPTPSISVTNIYSLPRQVSSPNAAAVFLNFVLGKEASAATCLDGDYMPFAYDDIPDCPPAPPDTALIVDYYPLLDDEVRNEISGILGLQ